ncbi:transport permease protein [Salinibacterium xinjiangense]|uniref:Transport permease protein n=1 Tax=Salinibacterium xinjiangense TaxID=386302 RepID=A0A2C8Z9W9_9MICO|nr:ABC transporter permease [Salinibacterium xinjiangense]GGK90944.1 transport permease protein [Salinibacterium xinjiangense]SOE60766.1 lipooligosaccharide transport system permease protein [Salinibacterium xinjiangense]
MSSVRVNPAGPDAAVKIRGSGSVRALYSGNASAVLGRGLLATRSTNWTIVLTGVFEPIFYLLALGIGLGSYVQNVTDPLGNQIPYAAYIAPALLAVSAMNGAIYDSTWNVFFKMHFGKLYEGMLATRLGPLDVALGEISLALLRGAAYGLAFLVVMQVLGLNLSWSAILALPALVVIAFGFASLGMGITSYLKTFQQMNWISFLLLPMFLLSGTFYPLSVYPQVIQFFVQLLPLWHGVELVRGLTTGALAPVMLLHLLYFAVMIAVGLFFTTRRLRALFLD